MKPLYLRRRGNARVAILSALVSVVAFSSCAGFQELGPKAQRLLEERLHGAASMPDALRALRRDFAAASGKGAKARMRAVAEGLWVARDRRIDAAQRGAVLRDLGLVLDDATVGRVEVFLHDRELAEDALHAIGRVPGLEGSRILARELAAAEHGGDASPELPASALVAALATRDDEAARAALLAHAKEPALGAIARRGLARMGVPAAEEALRMHAERSASGFADWALWLDHRKARSGGQAVVEREARALLAQGSKRARRTGFRLLTADGMRGAEWHARAMLGDADPVLRASAERCLIQLPELVDIASMRALAAGEGSAEFRPSALRVVSERGDPQASRLLGAAVDAGGALAIHAMRLIAERPRAADLPRLRAALAGAESQSRAAAAAGLLRYAQSKGGAELRKLGAEVLSADVDLSQKRQALGALRRAPHADVLGLVEGLPRALDGDIATTKLAVVGVLEDETRAHEILRDVLAKSKSSSTRRAAARALRARGDKVSDWARARGVLTDWHVVGPFAAPDKKTWTEAAFAAKGVDVSKPVRAGERELRWQEKRIEDIDGILEINFLGRRSNATAYAWTKIRCEQAEKLRLLVGSDDQIAIWCDGKLVHANFANRGCSPDQDKSELSLEPGTHELLFKIGQGGGGWAFCARLVDGAGRPQRR